MSKLFLQWQSVVQVGVLNSNFAILTTYIKSHTSLLMNEILSWICYFHSFLRRCVHVDVQVYFAMARFVSIFIATAVSNLVLNLIKWTATGHLPTGTLNHTNPEGQSRTKEWQWVSKWLKKKSQNHLASITVRETRTSLTQTLFRILMLNLIWPYKMAIPLDLMTLTTWSKY
jgi:hypothetical protein